MSSAIENNTEPATDDNAPALLTSPLKFTFPPSEPSFIRLNTPLEAYLTENPPITHLLVSAVVLHKSLNNNKNTRVLVVQRSPTDGFPLAWECPGGTVDPLDETILHALARELAEETGLAMKAVVAVLDDKTEFEGGRGKETWRKVTCLVEVDYYDENGDGEDEDEGEQFPRVALEPSEHCDYVWATEDEIDKGWVGNKEVRFAYEVQKETIKKAFGVAAAIAGEGEAGLT